MNRQKGFSSKKVNRPIWAKNAEKLFSEYRSDTACFIEKIEEAMLEYDHDRAFVKKIDPRQAQKQVSKFSSRLNELRDITDKLDSGTLLFIGLVTSHYMEESAKEIITEFTALRETLNDWDRWLAMPDLALKNEDGLKGENHPTTYARIRFQKKIIMIFSEVAELTAPASDLRKDFKDLFIDIMDYKSIPVAEPSRTLREIQSYMS